MRLWLATLLLVTALGCARRNFDTVCQLAKDILAEPRIEPGQRLERFRTQLSHLASGEALTAANKALAASPDQRFDAFMAVAAEAAPGWSCAALEPVLEAPNP
ncbi:MAG: hypothetical protein AAFX94_13140 [Myxococcota bacterium]